MGKKDQITESRVSNSSANQFIDVTLRISSHSCPRLYTAFLLTGGGKSGAALVRQLAEELLIRRESAGTSSNGQPRGREAPMTPELSIEQHQPTGEDDDLLAKSLRQFDF
ncbi:hypothetical protein [Paraburkholderia guartelaensis]|uniref:hypothetical protein n=1 Tax=Paraburkholderia guartelaensis TaxID=2546446 RepID=UPI002AB7D154|nr:hypothetical protein [Paraburkholderia guartelaensis]